MLETFLMTFLMTAREELFNGDVLIKKVYKLSWPRNIPRTRVLGSRYIDEQNIL